MITNGVPSFQAVRFAGAEEDRQAKIAALKAELAALEEPKTEVVLSPFAKFAKPFKEAGLEKHFAIVMRPEQYFPVAQAKRQLVYVEFKGTEANREAAWTALIKAFETAGAKTVTDEDDFGSFKRGYYEIGDTYFKVDMSPTKGGACSGGACGGML